MSQPFPRFPFLALCLCGGALVGCGSSLRPRPLTAAQSSLVDRAGSFGVVAVVEDPCVAPGRALAPMLERTGLFRAVVPSASGGPAPDYVATFRGQCDLGRDPSLSELLPFLTLGVVPEFRRTGLGASFTLRHLATGQEAVIPCEIGSVTGIGWIPMLMNVLPGWSSGNPEKTRSFGRRLAYGIVSRLNPR